MPVDMKAVGEEKDEEMKHKRNGEWVGQDKTSCQHQCKDGHP